MMKRIISCFVFTLFCGITFLWGQNKEPVLVILHTNDTHSQLDPFTNKKGKIVGGVVRRQEAINQYRKQYTELLLADAGDFSQGTPYFNYFKGDAEVKCMNLMGYDVVTLGNHEFDNGSAALAKRLKKAKFEIVCANYVFHHKALQKIVKPYTIIYRNGLKIGIFGLTVNLLGLVSPDIAAEATYKDPVPVAREMTHLLKNQEKCDLVICLSHLGYDNDKGRTSIYDTLLVKSVPDIDVLIGGHTHTLLEQSSKINGVQILQLVNRGEFIGKLLIYKKGK